MLLSVLVLAALLPGCVVAYDPAAPARFGIGEQSPMRLVAPPGPPSPLGADVPAVDPPPAPAHAAPRPAAQAPRPGAATIPGSPAGEQLAWLVAALGGEGDLRRVERRLSASFRERSSASDVRTTIEQWRRDVLGSGRVVLEEVSPEAERELSARVRSLATGRATLLRVSVDEAGLIRSLWLAPAVESTLASASSWAELDTHLAGLPGRAALAAYELIEPTPDGLRPLRHVHAFSPGLSMAIGAGGARLYVLAAAAQMVTSGEANWDGMITVQDSLKSLPPGRMQLLREGVEVTLAEVVDALCALGDHTAFDHLLERVGRRRAEDAARRFGGEGTRNIPFLSTMEAFRLKLTTDPDLAARYLTADETERRNLLAPGGPVEQAPIAPEAAAQWKSPRLVAEVGWFATATACCAMAAELRRVEQVPGMETLGRSLRKAQRDEIDGRTWRSAACLDGAEPGVFSATWLLQREDGRWFVMSLAWNNPGAALDAGRAGELSAAALRLLAREP